MMTEFWTWSSFSISLSLSPSKIFYTDPKTMKDSAIYETSKEKQKKKQKKRRII